MSLSFCFRPSYSLFFVGHVHLYRPHPSGSSYSSFVILPLSITQTCSVPVASVFDLLDENIYTGEINLGMLFSYGMYGYGASPQVKKTRVNCARGGEVALFKAK